MADTALDGKAHAENTQARFDERDGALSRTRCSSRFCKALKNVLVGGVGLAALVLKAEIPLPVGYAQLEWIKSSGAEYIKTGCLLEEYDIVHLDAEIPKSQPSSSGWCGVFGVRAKVGSSPAFILNVCTGTAGNGTYRYYRTSPQNKGTNSKFYDQRVMITCDKTAMTWRGADGSSGTVTTPGTSGSFAGLDPKYDMYVFELHSWDGYAVHQYGLSL